jgi:hypothetical protein
MPNWLTPGNMKGILRGVPQTHPPLAVLGAVIALAGGLYGIVNATSGGSAATRLTPARADPGGLAGGLRPNARSGPAAGGAAGDVADVSASGFTLRTATGQTVATSWSAGKRSSSASRISAGRTRPSVRNGKRNDDHSESGHSPAGEPRWIRSVVGCRPGRVRPGAQFASKDVGQIPASTVLGSGRSSMARPRPPRPKVHWRPTQAESSTVVKLSNGQYEVHTIGVSWPHHIYVGHDPKVIGAD